MAICASQVPGSLVSPHVRLVLCKLLCGFFSLDPDGYSGHARLFSLIKDKQKQDMLSTVQGYEMNVHFLHMSFHLDGDGGGTPSVVEPEMEEAWASHSPHAQEPIKK